MFQIQAPILIVPTADAKLAVGVHLHAAGLAAYREIALAAKGLEIAHLQFVFRGLTLAVCSRVRRDGIVEIEIGLGHIVEQLRGLIVALFMPIFFSLAGLQADLTIFRDPTLFFLTVGLILIASLGKFAGAFLGGVFGGLSARESLALGCGMNARGSTEVIVASIGLSMGALSQDLFTMIVAMAVVTTLAMPPTLRWALSRLPLRTDERDRLEREAFEATGFVTNIKRLLVAVDDSANGKLGWHLADMLARSRGIPMTVLHLGRPERDQGIETAPARGIEAVASGVNETP